MSSAPIPNNGLPINKQMEKDLEQPFKDILSKHLAGREINEDNIYSWMDNILIDSKEYFRQKYPDYDIFIYIFVCPKNINFCSNGGPISNLNTDWNSSVAFITDILFSKLCYFYYKHVDLNYELEKYENEIIQKGNEIMRKYLQGRKYRNGSDINNYNNYINNEHGNFIMSKEKNIIKCYFLNEIFQNPIQGKYYFKYLSYGKQIYSKIFQTYENDSLTCCHSVFFFK